MDRYRDLLAHVDLAVAWMMMHIHTADVVDKVVYLCRLHSVVPPYSVVLHMVLLFLNRKKQEKLNHFASSKINEIILTNIEHSQKI